MGQAWAIRDTLVMDQLASRILALFSLSGQFLPVHSGKVLQVGTLPGTLQTSSLIFSL